MFNKHYYSKSIVSLPVCRFPTLGHGRLYSTKYSIKVPMGHLMLETRWNFQANALADIDVPNVIEVGIQLILL